MKCETCGAEMKWEGPLQGGFMVCWPCRTADKLNAACEENPLQTIHFDYASAQLDYPVDSDDPAPYDEGE